jgi:hypothetical protein
MLEAFLAIFPDDSPSPMQILRMGEVKARKRVRNPRGANNSLGTSAMRSTGATNANANSVAENSAEYVAGDAVSSTKGKTSAAKTKRKTPWVWGEDK